MMQPDDMPQMRRHRPPGVLRLFLRMGGWSVIGLGVAVVVLSLWAEREARIAQQFADTGERTQARVLDHLVRSQLNSDGSISYSYGLSLGFVTGTGEEVEVVKPVGRTEFNAVVPGAAMNVQYLPQRPEHVRFGPVMPRGRGMQYTALLLGVLSLWGLSRIGARAVSAVKARNTGVRERAVVTDLRRSYIRGVTGERYRLIWEDAEGHVGQSLLHRRRDLADLVPGTPIRIYRDGPHMWWDGDVGLHV